MLVDKIHASLENISNLFNEDNEHMKKVFEMLVGGLVIPELVREDSSLIDEDNGFKEMLFQYSKENINKILNPDNVVEKVVEVEKIVEVVKEVNTRVKHRRLKNYTIRPKKQERVLTPFDRETIIKWWNVEQRLASKDDPACKELADTINNNSGNPKPLAPYQVNGFISHLCRLGLKSFDVRNNMIHNAMVRGDYSIIPDYSKNLLELIAINHEESKRDKEEGYKIREQKRLALAATI